MEHYAIDRITGGIAVIEQPDGSFMEFPLADLPDGAREGDLLVRQGDGSFVVDVPGTQARKKRLLDLQDTLFRNK